PDFANLVGPWPPAARSAPGSVGPSGWIATQNAPAPEPGAADVFQSYLSAPAGRCAERCRDQNGPATGCADWQSHAGSAAQDPGPGPVIRRQAPGCCGPDPEKNSNRLPRPQLGLAYFLRPPALPPDPGWQSAPAQCGSLHHRPEL